MRSSNLFTFTCVCVLLIPSTLFANTTISDGEFLDSNWIAGITTTGVGAAAGAFVGGEQSTNPGVAGGMIDGNPGVYRYFHQTHGGRQNGTMTARSFHISEAFRHDPSIESLQSVSIEFDAYMIDNGDGLANQAGPSNQITVGAAIRQDQKFFFVESGITGRIGDYEVWTPFQFNSLTANDFVFSGTVGSGQPIPLVDFSTTGMPIAFGYYAFTSNNFTTRGRGGVDNWQLEVNPIPEPSSFIMLLIACGFVVWKIRT